MIFYRFIIKPALPGLLCILGFIVGALLGLLEPSIGLGWGGIIGAVAGGIFGSFLQTMLSHIGL